jgi:hypothetical protein
MPRQRMLKKVFIQMMLGNPHPWLEEYVENVNRLEKYGWYWYVFSDKDIKSKGNFRVFPFTLGEFTKRVLEKTGIDSENYIDPEFGYPHKLLSDYYPAYGLLFDDYIKDVDYWGHTNWDVAYGRLDHFYPDRMLRQWDIIADCVVEAINGPFTLYKNTERVNNLWKEVPDWQTMFKDHILYYFDEKHFSQTLEKIVGRGDIKLWRPKYYPEHSYDRLIPHVPEPRLSLKEDGSLYEEFLDTRLGTYPHGREIPFFHFSRTKKWIFA